MDSERENDNLNLNIINTLPIFLNNGIKNECDSITKPDAKVEKESKKKHSSQHICANCLNNRTHSNLKENELNDNIKKVIKQMLLELRKIYKALIEAAGTIERIFDYTLYHLASDKKNQCYFNFEEIHKEEFSYTITNDEFLKVYFLITNLGYFNASQTKTQTKFTLF